MTPGQQAKRSRQAILFFGCSVTFGEGVADDETWPFYVSQMAKDFTVYNYGVFGYGPQQMLVKLQDPELLNEVDEKKSAILVYTYIDNHIERVIGSLAANWTRKVPYFVRDGENHLIRKGSFISGRPFLTHLYDLMNKSALIRFLYGRLHFPRISEEDIKLTARIIEESRNLFRERFKSNNFYVVIYPGNGYYVPRLAPYLERAGIKYFDYSIRPNDAMKEHLPHDLHPSPKSYKAIALKLSHDLKLTEDAAELAAVH